MTKTKLYTCFTPSHSKLYQDHFIPSFMDAFLKGIQIEAKFLGHITGPGFFMSESWRLAIQKKIELIIQAVEDNLGKLFIWSDVDVQFFKYNNNPEATIEEVLYSALGTLDIVFQKDNLSGDVNTGFFICRASQITLRLWKAAEAICKIDFGTNDQEAINYILRGEGSKTEVGYGYLPDVFYSPGPLNVKKVWWHKGEPLELPNKGKILLHHATWAKSVEQKVHQLRQVKELVWS